MSKIFTYQAKIDNADKIYDFLEDSASLFSKIERKLFAAHNKGCDIKKIKSEYISHFGINARHFNSIRINLEGKIASSFAIRDNNIDETKNKITKTVNIISKLKNKLKLTANQANKSHQKRRLLASLKHKLSNLELDKTNNKIRICFGSKKLFNKQFNLEENNYKEHTEWLQDWQKARDNQFYLIGSKDETMGNQNCVATINEDNNSINLRLRVPKNLETKYGKYILIENVKLNYGKDAVFSALNCNIKRNYLQKKNSKALHGDLFKNYGQAINYRFLKTEKDFKVFITVTKSAPQQESNKLFGSIGVDINANHLAVSEIDNTGNLIKSFNVPLCTYGKSSAQSKALIGDAIKQIVAYAKIKQKPIIVEKLDFKKKKRALKEASPKYARMLSSFSYSLILQMLNSRAFRHGIEVFAVNPAYSSVIGRIKFCRIYKISVHQAAALVIARRFYRYSERLPYCWNNIPDNKGCHVALPKLVKISGKHVWHLWAKVWKNLQAALAVQYQMNRQAKNSIGATGSLIEDIPF